MMTEVDIFRDPEFIARANEINRLRDLQFRANDLGIDIEIDQDVCVDDVAVKISLIIKEDKELIK